MVLSACGASPTSDESPAATNTTASVADAAEPGTQPAPAATEDTPAAIQDTPAATEEAPATTDEAPMSASEIFSQISPSVPLIETPSATGSGILIDGGYVVTNYHVVWPYDSAWVVFPDGTEFQDVPVIGWDPFADLAVLGVVSHPASPLHLADGEDMGPGSDVFLVGYPGETDLFPEPSITRGILSRIREWDPYLMTMLQTDALIASGQSGGALVDSRGRVVGISTWQFEENGFAVATSAADDAEIVQALIEAREEFGFSDRRAPGGLGEFDVRVDLAHGWETRSFVFEGSAGTMIHVELDGLDDGAISISGPDGLILEVDDSFSGVEAGTVELLSDGVYYVTVSTASGDASVPASYVLSSSVRLSPFHDPDDGVHLYVGDQFGAVIDHHADSDSFSITLTEGETVVFRTDAIATDTFIVAFPSTDFEAIAWDDDSGRTLFGDSFNAELVYTASVTGEHHIVVGDATGAGGGGYFLVVDYSPALGAGSVAADPAAGDAVPNAGDDHADWLDGATPIVVGAPAEGAMASATDIDFFSFEAEQGETYQIDVEPGTLDDPIAELYDEVGNWLGSNDDFGGTLAPRLFWSAPASGRYFVAVSGWSSTGSYTLTVTTPGLDDGRSNESDGTASITPDADTPDAVGLPGEGVDVVAGRANWHTGYFQAELYRQLLEELGYNVSDPYDLELGPNIAYRAMAQGEMDYWPNSWYPTHDVWGWEELPDGTLVGDHLTILGEEMVDGGLQGLLVTKSFADEYRVYTMDQLNSDAAALAAFDATDPVPGNGLADIFGCPESWRCYSTIEDQIAFGGWDNIAQISADYDIMFAEAVDAVADGSPTVAYTWTPSSYLTQLRPGDNVYWMGVDDILESERGVDGSGGYAAIGQWQCPSAAYTFGAGCPIGWTVNDILVTARTEFLDANPAAATLLTLVRLPMIDVSLAIAEQDEGADPASLAAEWIADNRGRVDGWIAAALAAA